MFDIKEKIGELVEKAKNSPEFLAELKKDPTGAIKKYFGIDIPKEQALAILEGIKDKFKSGEIAETLGGIFGFGKKDK